MSAPHDEARLLLEIADAWMGIPAARVQAIHPASALTPLPGAPIWLQGLVWSGEVPVGVVDVAALDGRGTTTARLAVRLDGTGLAIAATAVRGATAAHPAEPLDVDALIARVAAGLGG